MDQESKLNQLKRELANTPLEDLSYILGRYCGPHNVLLAEKKYGHELAKKLQRIVSDEIASRSIEEFLLTDTE
jgi:hypothetical protein